MGLCVQVQINAIGPLRVVAALDPLLGEASKVNQLYTCLYVEMVDCLYVEKVDDLNVIVQAMLSCFRHLLYQTSFLGRS